MALALPYGQNKRMKLFNQPIDLPKHSLEIYAFTKDKNLKIYKNFYNMQALENR